MWWHVDNPTRNQSLHSCCGNMRANMLPGDAALLFRGYRAPGDWRARWNWGVVTTEWTSNELLHDKWDATWEMWKPSHGEWRVGVNGSNHAFSSHHSYGCECVWVRVVDKWHGNSLRCRKHTCAATSLSGWHNEHVDVRSSTRDLEPPGAGPAKSPIPVFLFFVFFFPRHAGCCCWSHNWLRNKMDAIPAGDSGGWGDLIMPR